MIVKGNQNNFTPAPAGAHQAVCVDWIDLGNVETAFGIKHKFRVVFQVAAINQETGRRFTVRKSMNALLSKGKPGKRNSGMYDLLVQWRGRDFTKEELTAGIDVEDTIGRNCMIFVTHKPSDSGEVYAELSGISPVQPGTPLLQPLDYVRENQRQPQTQTAPMAAAYIPPATAAPAAPKAPF